MFGRETRMLLRHYLDQGRSKSALVPAGLDENCPVADGPLDLAFRLGSVGSARARDEAPVVREPTGRTFLHDAASITSASSGSSAWRICESMGPLTSARA
jgi:hypothetical protein